MSIGLPTLEITFKVAAETVAARSKQGVAALLVKDAGSNIAGLYKIKREKDIPSGLSAGNAAHVKRALEGSSLGQPALVYLAVVASTAEDLSDGLALLEGCEIDYLAGPADAETEDCSEIKAWVLAQRAKYRTVKAVLPNTAGGDMGIINFTSSGITTAAGSCTTAEYCARIAGILAGTPPYCSATYAPLPEVTAVTETASVDTAIGNGELVLIHDGVKAKIARAVNSLTTVPANGQESWKKIKIVEAMDLITYYARMTIEDEYLGKCANTYDNKCLLVSAIDSYHKVLEAEGVLQAGRSTAEIDLEAQESWLKEQGVDTSAMTQQEIKEADTGSWVFIKATGRPQDAMEDFVLNYSV